MHRLLQRQLKRHLGPIASLPPEWQGFLQAVDEAYRQFDDDRIMLERSLELSSEELLQANHQLQGWLDAVEAQVAERTAELATTNRDLKQTLADLQNAQVQLVQAEKMSSLGQLVAGIAHEINNPVNFIYGNLVYVRNYVSDLLSFVACFQKCYPTPLPELVEQAEELDLDYLQNDLPKLLNSMEMGTSRIQDIVLSLRNFSRKDEAEYKRVDVHQGIESTLMILESRFKAQRYRPAIEIIRNYGQLPLVECYAGRLNQVLMNLLVNAIDALDERDQQRSIEENQETSSCIWITTESVQDQSVVIRVKDNGPGIAIEIQQKLFDPFFTTKPVGKGTGMGLSISYKIITEQHRGTIQCQSALNEGTEFIVEIPIHQGAVIC